MQKVNLSMLVQYQILESKIFASDKGKATILKTLFSKVYSRKKKNTLPDFEPVYEANISEVIFLKKKLKINCLI